MPFIKMRAWVQLLVLGIASTIAGPAKVVHVLKVRYVTFFSGITQFMQAVDALHVDNTGKVLRMAEYYAGSEEFMYLGDLVPTHQSVGWASYLVNRNWSEVLRIACLCKPYHRYMRGFLIAGKKYEDGVFAHAPSDIRYDLQKRFRFAWHPFSVVTHACVSYFSACVGLDDGGGECQNRLARRD